MLQNLLAMHFIYRENSASFKQELLHELEVFVLQGLYKNMLGRLPLRTKLLRFFPSNGISLDCPNINKNKSLAEMS